MRILFILNTTEMYGANYSFLILARYLKKNNCEVLISCPDSAVMRSNLGGSDDFIFTRDTSSSWMIKNLRTEAGLSFKDVLRFLKRSIYAVLHISLDVCALYQVIRKEHIDIIYSNTSVQIHGFLAAKLFRIRHIWHIREFGQLDYGLAPIFFSQKLRKVIIQRSDEIIFISNSLKNWYSINGRNVYVVYNGVNILAWQEPLKVRPRKMQLLIVGSLFPFKGQHIAIEAISRLDGDLRNRLHLHIYGNGDLDYESQLKQLVRDLRLENVVTLHGYVNDLKVIYAEKDLLLVCSKCEAFGRVTIESMSRGVLVLGNNTCGTSEIIIPGKTGFTYERTAHDLSRVLTKVFSMNQDDWIQVKYNAREEIERSFSAYQYQNRIFNIIREGKTVKQE